MATTSDPIPTAGVGPASLVVTSPVRAYEDPPFSSRESRDAPRASPMARGGGPPAVERDPPGLFLARTRSRVEDLTARIESAVEHESLAADALADIQARGRNVMAAARAAAADGVITPREHEQVWMLLRDAERESTSAVPIHRAWQGGEAYWR